MTKRTSIMPYLAIALATALMAMVLLSMTGCQPLDQISYGVIDATTPTTQPTTMQAIVGAAQAGADVAAAAGVPGADLVKYGITILALLAGAYVKLRHSQDKATTEKAIDDLAAAGKLSAEASDKLRGLFKKK